jgi:hypothetical protein
MIDINFGSFLTMSHNEKKTQFCFGEGERTTLFSINRPLYKLPTQLIKAYQFLASRDSYPIPLVGRLICSIGFLISGVFGVVAGPSDKKDLPFLLNFS